MSTNAEGVQLLRLRKYEQVMTRKEIGKLAFLGIRDKNTKVLLKK